MVFDILCGEIPEVRALENGPSSSSSKGQPSTRRSAPRRGVVAGSHGRHEEDLVSVTIPEGAMPGQTIAIMAAGGTRKVKATVPAGLKPGDTFLVRLATPIHTEPATAVSTLPPPVHHSARREQPSIPAPRSQNQETTTTTTTPHFAQSLDEWLTPTPEVQKKTAPNNLSVPETIDQLLHQHRDPPSYAARGFISGREAPEDYYHHYGSELSNAGSKEIDVREQPLALDQEQPLRQKLLLIQVPPGMPPGTVLQVEIPGESRTVTAQIPPQVDSFYVAYTPQQPKPRATIQTEHTQRSPPVPQLPAPPVMPKQQQHQPPLEHPVQEHQKVQDHPEQPTKPKRKLLLVRVPPNTTQGATLHVSIPDEPGRILAAVVPPGDLKEFHVSYEPRKKQSRQKKQQPSSARYENRHEIQQIQYYGDDTTGASAGEPAYEHFNSSY